MQPRQRDWPRLVEKKRPRTHSLIKAGRRSVGARQHENTQDVRQTPSVGTQRLGSSRSHRYPAKLESWCWCHCCWSWCGWVGVLTIGFMSLSHAPESSWLLLLAAASHPVSGSCAARSIFANAFVLTSASTALALSPHVVAIAAEFAPRKRPSIVMVRVEGTQQSPSRRASLQHGSEFHSVVSYSYSQALMPCKKGIGV